jgi:SsrA-binding protein
MGMRILNRKISREYELVEKIEAGISLNGPEVKSISEGKATIDDAFAKITNSEVWLYNFHVHPYRFADTTKINTRRPRKLLLHRKEILNLEAKIQQKKLTLVPTMCYNTDGKIKIELALGRRKKIYEKRRDSRKKDSIWG